FLGLALVVMACGAASKEPAPPIGTTPPGEVARGEHPSPAATGAEDAGAPPSEGGPSAAPDAGDGGCPYGRLEDPHRGFVRCLNADEAAAGWLPPPPQAEPVDAGPPPSMAPPSVEIGAPSFENGDVPKAEKFIHGFEEGIAKCIATHGGMTGSSAKIKLQ